MAKRFSATELWEEDWFLDMPIEYKLFWFYMLSTCDHAGFYKVNLKVFSATNSISIKADKAIELFNVGKKRIRIVRDGFWFIEEFILFQYGHRLNIKNQLHKSVLGLLDKFKVPLTSIKGVERVSDTSS